jgi:hypothetical protein
MTDYASLLGALGDAIANLDAYIDRRAAEVASGPAPPVG